MTPGKLLSEIQVGGAINDARWQLARDAYVEFDPNNRVPDSELVTPDPGYWIDRLEPHSWASGTVARLPFGALNEPVYSYKHEKLYENPFDMPFRFTLANGPEWGQEMFEEAVRALQAEHSVYWYWGKPGIGLYDSLALDIVKALPGTHIVDATNGADGRPSWMRKDWWGEAWPDENDRAYYYGAYCFARNLIPNLVAEDRPDAEATNARRIQETNDRIRNGVRYSGNGRIISCHEPADFEWLLGTTVTRLVNGPADMPTWEILLKSGISLAFRGDEAKVNADLGGRLSELKEVAG